MHARHPQGHQHHSSHRPSPPGHFAAGVMPNARHSPQAPALTPSAEAPGPVLRRPALRRLVAGSWPEALREVPVAHRAECMFTAERQEDGRVPRAEQAAAVPESRRRVPCRLGSQLCRKARIALRARRHRVQLPVRAPSVDSSSGRDSRTDVDDSADGRGSSAGVAEARECGPAVAERYARRRSSWMWQQRFALLRPHTRYYGLHIGDSQLEDAVLNDWRTCDPRQRMLERIRADPDRTERLAKLADKFDEVF